MVESSTEENRDIQYWVNKYNMAQNTCTSDTLNNSTRSLSLLHITYYMKNSPRNIIRLQCVYTIINSMAQQKN